MELDSNAQDLDGIFQDIPTTSQQQYSLTFYLRSRSADPQSDSEKVKVSWGGASLGTFAADAAQTWQLFTLAVTGSGGTDRLQFEELDSGNDGRGPLLDGVSVRAE